MKMKITLIAFLTFIIGLSNCYAQLKFEHSYDKKTKILECTITNESNNQVIFSQARHMYDGKSHINVTFRGVKAGSVYDITTFYLAFEQKLAVIMEAGDIKKYEYDLKELAAIDSASHAKSVRIEGTVRSMSLPSEETKVVNFDHTFDY